MKTIQITVERNFHIMNDDKFIMEKISVVKEPEAHNTIHDCINIAREEIETNFRAAYPHIEEHLNFHVVKQVNNSFKESIMDVPFVAKDGFLKAHGEANYKMAQELIKEPELINIIQEINTCKSLTVLKIYEKQLKTPEQICAYDLKFKELGGGEEPKKIHKNHTKHSHSTH